jgi:hypothetical protein
MLDRLLRYIQSHRLWCLVGFFLVIAATRIGRLSSLSMGVDEVWAIWQTFGTPAQVVSWTPVDWTPTYFLLLWVWQHLAGIHPLVLHYLSLLIYLLGCAFTYRMMRCLTGGGAGLIGLAVYTALSYSIYISTEVRGYALVVALLPFALWMLTRYFRRPTARNAIPLALALAGMFSMHLSSIIAFLLLGVYSLLVYRRQIWRWWLPGLIAAVLASPFIISKLTLMMNHENAVPNLVRKSVPETLGNVLLYFGDFPAIWLVLFIVAAFLLIKHRPWHIQPLTMLAALVTAGVFTYWIMALDNIRYFWWTLIGYTFFIGWGLSYLWKPAKLGILVLLIVLMFIPVPIDQYQRYQATDTALIDNFKLLSKNIRWGDVVLVDPSAQISREGLDYATRVFFPNGLRYVENPEGYRRVWYLTHVTHENPQILPLIAKGRIAREFVGPPTALLRLYEAPPDLTGVLFKNGMRFLGSDVIGDDDLEETGPFVLHEGETIKLRLWWAVDRDLAVKGDYFVDVYIFDSSGSTVAESSSVPKVIDQPDRTSQWTSFAYFLDNRALTLPFPTHDGLYRILVGVHDPQTLERTPVSGENSDNLLPVLTFVVKSW